jgi:hypothetical protein
MKGGNLQMRKILEKAAVLLIFCVFLMGAAVSAEDTGAGVIYVLKNSIGVKVNSDYIANDNFVLDGRTYIPVRTLSEMLGVSIEYDADEKNVIIAPSKTVEKTAAGIDYMPEYRLAQPVSAEKDGVTVTVDGELFPDTVYLVGGTTYAPLRAVCEALGCVVYYDAATLSARIYSKDYLSFDADTALVYGASQQTVTKAQLEDLANNIYGSWETGKNLGYQHVIDLFFNKIALEALCEKLDIEVSEEKFEEHLEESGVNAQLAGAAFNDDAALKENLLKNNYLYSLIMETDLTKSYIPSDEDMIMAYIGSEYSLGHWMKAKHILISDKEKAEKILEEINNGGDFDALMFENTEDPGTGAYPDGYVFRDGQMVDAFYQAALALNENEVSGLVRSGYGWHIIKKIADYQSGAPFLEVKDELLINYAAEAVQADFGAVRINADVVLNPALINQE